MTARPLLQRTFVMADHASLTVISAPSDGYVLA